MTMIKLMLEA